MELCNVEGCEKPATQGKRGMCYGHYMRAYRYGDPLAPRRRQYVDVTGQRFGRLTVVEREPKPSRFWLCRCDCGATASRTTNALTSGLSTSCGAPDCQRKDEVGYSAAHMRVRTRRGPASAHPCVDCGEPARQWSYDKDDPDERVAVVGDKTYAYSMDVSHYEPRCVSCHKTFDLHG